MRVDGRANDQLRNVSIQPGFLRNAYASALVEFGVTRVLCAATVLNELPPWMKAKGAEGGWLTAEYEMLPASSGERIRRERSGAGGRTQEIQRLVGRALRAACDLKKIGQRTIYIDCDVLDADGGTRCASITGAMVCLRMALGRLLFEGKLSADPLTANVAAVSVGVVKGEVLLDLCYAEDSSAEVDMNVVMTSGGRLVEVQGTAEGAPFERKTHDAMLDCAEKGIQKIIETQNAAISGWRPTRS